MHAETKLNQNTSGMRVISRQPIENDKWQPVTVTTWYDTTRYIKFLHRGSLSLFNIQNMTWSDYTISMI